jgi:hypothetical protein
MDAMGLVIAHELLDALPLYRVTQQDGALRELYVGEHGAALAFETGEPSKPCQFTPNAKCDEWMVEGGTPNTLLRRGITKESLAKGTEIVVDGYQTRDHSLTRANGRNVTFPDGRKLFPDRRTGAPRTDGIPGTLRKVPVRQGAVWRVHVDDQGLRRRARVAVDMYHA